MQEPVEVLAVDDSHTSLEAIRAVVEPLGATLATATSGEAALRHLLHEPDLAAILLDIGLPGMDGFETAAAIRRRQKTRYVPIIFVTGQDAPELSLEAYSAGAVDYIVKPFDAAVLRSKLAVCQLQIRQGERDSKFVAAETREHGIRAELIHQ